MNERERFWQLLTVCTDPRSFSYNDNKKTIKVELPILPENVKDFKQNILSMFGNPDKPAEDWDNNPIYYNYKFDSRYIDIDNETIQLNKFGQLSVSEKNLVSDIETKVLEKLDIDIKNDQLLLNSFPGFNKYSSSLPKNTTTYPQSYTSLDYSDPDNWFLYPRVSSGLLDVFILYPSMIDEKDGDYIISPHNVKVQNNIIKFIETIAPIFKELPVNLYMPKYRQLNRSKIQWSEGGILNPDIEEVIDDVFSSFDYFIKHQSTSQFITFSDEQGSIFNNMLAAIFPQYGDILGRWVNSWSLGVGLNGITLDNSPFRPSGLPDDKQTIISWNLATESEITKKRKFWCSDSICVNPITFKKTQESQLKENNISIINTKNNLYQIKQNMIATIVKNEYNSEIVLVNFNEKDLFTDEEILKLDENNESYLSKNNIGFFAENIRNNMIMRYNL